MPMTQQEVFTKVATHMLTQRKRATDTGPGWESPCRYRTDSGLMCAVGCLVPDAVYDHSMEGQILPGVIDLAYEGSLPGPLAEFVKTDLEPHLGLLRTLQQIHDSEPAGDWRYQLQMAAELYRLDMPASPKGA